jgi:hypothetical protein
MLPMSEAIRRAVAWAVEEWPEEGEGGQVDGLGWATYHVRVLEDD